jgi:DNA-binding XRE family transcriptional regulator
MKETIRFSAIVDAWKRDPEFLAEYERIGPAMALAFALGEARQAAGLTQTEVARRIGTSQAAVARLESGVGNPNWETLERYAKAVGRRLAVRLEPVEND